MTKVWEQMTFVWPLSNSSSRVGQQLDPKQAKQLAADPATRQASIFSIHGTSWRRHGWSKKRGGAQSTPGMNFEPHGETRISSPRGELILWACWNMRRHFEEWNSFWGYITSVSSQMKSGLLQVSWCDWNALVKIPLPDWDRWRMQGSFHVHNSFLLM